MPMVAGSQLLNARMDVGARMMAMGELAVNLDILAKRINAAHAEFEQSMRSSLDAAVRAGELLLTVKQQLPHGKWLPWLKENFKGSQPTAFRYMKVASRLTLIDPNYSRMNNLSLNAAIRMIRQEENGSGVGNPEITVSETDSTESLDTLIAAGKKFATIYADPPWQYGNQGTRASTDNHYPTMTPTEISALPIESLAADNAHLHLWTTNAFLFEAKAVMEAWGFEYKSTFIWVKPQMGIGNYWRVSHEFMLFGLRGSCPFLARDQMSWMELPRTRHSAKPSEIRKTIELVSPPARLELFGRDQHEGWTVWGNQIERTVFDPEAA